MTAQPIELTEASVNRYSSEEFSLVVSEMYQEPTIQGEGPAIGTPCWFLRLGGCNLHCSWCDTAYTWAFSPRLAQLSDFKTQYDPRVELKKVKTPDVLSWLRESYRQWPSVRTLVISGGEPLLQDRALEILLRGLRGEFALWEVHVETNGTIFPTHSSQYFDLISVSPKLKSSGNSLEERRQIRPLSQLASLPQSVFKFVAAGPEDLEEIDTLTRSCGIDPERIYIMPEGVTQQALQEHSKALVMEVIQRGYRMTPRLHIQLFGNVRGR